MANFYLKGTCLPGYSIYEHYIDYIGKFFFPDVTMRQHILVEIKCYDL